MEPMQEDCFDALASMKTEQDLFDQMAKMAQSLGFEYCAYGVRMPVPISQPKVAIFNNYPGEWQKCYRERNYLQIDPTVQHALRSNIPLIWSPEVFAPAPEMWEEARGHGLHAGWAQASRDGSGSVGLLTLARGDTPISAAELRANQARMSWLAQYGHAAMAQVLAPKLAPELAASLTLREREILKWTAEGKTCFEVAQILSISERTVNFHVTNVMAKLGCTNKTQAAVKAAALGLLL